MKVELEIVREEVKKIKLEKEKIAEENKQKESDIGKLSSEISLMEKKSSSDSVRSKNKSQIIPDSKVFQK